MLAIASRSYQEARKILESTLGGFSEQFAFDKNNAHRKEFGKEKNGGAIADAQSQRLELLRMIEQAVELMLLEYSVLSRMDRHSQVPTRNVAALPDSPTAKIELLNSSNEMIDRGVKLARKIRDSDLSSDSHEVVLANWCETRLMMHRSAVASRRRMLIADTFSIPDAMGILSDAEAKLRVSDARRSRSEIAMIDLHRADAKICEAESVLLMQRDGEPLSLADFVCGLKTAIHRVEHSKNAEVLLRAGALAIDANRFLNRAEPVLRDRRRNIWWTTWFFERKLRAIALCLAVSVFDLGTPIPFLGLEATMRKTETEVDRLLLDAVRMIRVDSYRLATVIDAYMSSMVALNVRLASESYDSQKDRLPLRQTQMLLNLREACFSLEKAQSNRHTYYGNRSDARREEGRKVDSRVQSYVDAVRIRAQEHLTDSDNDARLMSHDEQLIYNELAERLSKSIYPWKGNSTEAFRQAKEIVKADPLRVLAKLGLSSEELSWATSLWPKRIEKWKESRHLAA